MASKPKSELRANMNLSAYDIFQAESVPDEDTERAIAELRACISTTTRKIDELEAKRAG
jgi:hypothetical protein